MRGGSDFAWHVSEGGELYTLRTIQHLCNDVDGRAGSEHHRIDAGGMRAKTRLVDMGVYNPIPICAMKVELHTEKIGSSTRRPMQAAVLERAKQWAWGCSDCCIAGRVRSYPSTRTDEKGRAPS